MYPKDKLFSSFYNCLGYYEMDLETHVFIGDNNHKYINATIFHENTHLSLVACSSYGYFQQFIVSCLKNVSTLSPNTKQNLENILLNSVEHSIVVQEGVATYCEILFIEHQTNAAEASKILKCKPDIYIEGYNLIASIIDYLDFPFIEKDFLAKFIGECTLNTDLVEYLSILFDKKTRTILNQIKRNSPNDRLRLLNEFTSDKNKVKQLKKEFKKHIDRNIGDYIDLSQEITNEELRGKLSYSFQQVINKMVFSIYGGGYYENSKNLIINNTKKIIEKGLSLGFYELENFEVKGGSVYDSEGDINLEQTNINKIDYAIPEEKLDFSQIELMLNHPNLICGNEIGYVHIFNPRQGFNNVEIQGKSELSIKDVIIVNSSNQKGQEYIFRESLIEISKIDLLKQIERVKHKNIVFVSSSYYYENKKTKIIILNILKKLKGQTLYLYLPSTTNSYLKDFFLNTIFENTFGISFNLENKELSFIFLFSKKTNIVFFTIISQVTSFHLKTWFKDNMPSFQWRHDGTIGNPNIEHLTAIMTHYILYGY